MRILVVHAHPDPGSFNAAVFRKSCEVLAARGGEVDALDLYAEEFEPVMHRDERMRYHDKGANELGLEHHLARLMAADGIVFVYPTWWYGLPAMLKGWLERVRLPHRSFIIPNSGDRGPIRPGMTHVRLLGGISTYGAPWLWTKWIGILGGGRSCAGSACSAIHAGDVLGRALPDGPVDAREPLGISCTRRSKTASPAIAAVAA